MVCVHSDLLSVNIYGGESLSMRSEVPLAEQRAVETCGRIGGVGGVGGYSARKTSEIVLFLRRVVSHASRV